MRVTIVVRKCWFTLISFSRGEADGREGLRIRGVGENVARKIDFY